MRISKLREVFDKKYEQSFTDEVFKVAGCLARSPPPYKLILFYYFIILYYYYLLIRPPKRLPKMGRAAEK